MKPATVTHSVKCCLFFRGQLFLLITEHLSVSVPSLFATINMGAVIVMIISSPLQWPAIVSWQCNVAFYQTMGAGVVRQGLSWNSTIHQPLKVKRSGTVKFGPRAMKSRTEQNSDSSVKVIRPLAVLKRLPLFESRLNFASYWVVTPFSQGHSLLLWPLTILPLGW